MRAIWKELTRRGVAGGVVRSLKGSPVLASEGFLAELTERPLAHLEAARINGNGCYTLRTSGSEQAYDTQRRQDLKNIVLQDCDTPGQPPYASLISRLFRLVEALGCSVVFLTGKGSRVPERAMHSSVSECQGLCSGGIGEKCLRSQNGAVRVRSMSRVGAQENRVPVS